MSSARRIEEEEESEEEDDSSSYETDSEEESEEEESSEEEQEQWAGDEDVEHQRSGRRRPSQQARSSQPSSNGAARPVAPAQESTRSVNPDFQDVRQTGKWGSVSRREMYIVLGVAIAIVAGIVATVVVLVTRDDDDSTPPPPERPPPPTAAPSLAPTRAPLEASVAVVRAAIGGLPSIAGTLAGLPEDPEAYEDLFNNGNADFNKRAMSWVLYGDPMEPGPMNPELTLRYALATLYYATDGPEWTNNDNWLSEESICTWHGLFCDVQNALVEIDLSGNNLQNVLPNEIALLQDVRAISFRRNSLTGSVPAFALIEIPGLSILYLDNNLFTGSLDNVLSEGVISVLFVQNNNFDRGFFPTGFCEGNSLALDKAGIDCDITRCLCCKPVEHCL